MRRAVPKRRSRRFPTTTTRSRCSRTCAKTRVVSKRRSRSRSGTSPRRRIRSTGCASVSCSRGWGRAEEARAAFAEFSAGARAESDKIDNANRELAFYLADEGRDPAAALRVADLERARRRDVLTLEARAWALHRNGRHAEARAEIESALAVGVRDPRLLYRAGVIAIAQGDGAAARRWLEAAATQIPGSRWSDLARAELDAPSPALAWLAGAAIAAAVGVSVAVGRGSKTRVPNARLMPAN